MEELGYDVRIIIKLNLKGITCGLYLMLLLFIHLPFTDKLDDTLLSTYL
jgi:hypothetical protein